MFSNIVSLCECLFSYNCLVSVSCVSLILCLIAEDLPGYGIGATPVDWAITTDGQRWTHVRANLIFDPSRAVKLFAKSPKPGASLIRLLGRHRLNQRRLDQTVETYAIGILDHSVLLDIGGTIVLMPLDKELISNCQASSSLLVGNR